MMDRSKKFLSDILTSISLIEEFKKNNSSYDEYDKDNKTQSTLERQLSIIGEAVNGFIKIEGVDSLENAKKIVGFRNRLIHAYDSIDNAMV